MDRLTEFLRGFGLVVISGGSSGIGAAMLSEIFAANPGVRAVNLSRRPASAPEGASLVNISCDLSDRASLGRALEELRPHVSSARGRGRIMLINNAGFGDYSEFCDSDFGKVSSMLDVNVRAPLALVHAMCRDLCESRGAVLNVCSTAAFQPTPFMACYGASKAYMLNWSVALAAELGPRGCGVSALCPGPTPTGFFSAAGFSSEILPDRVGGSARSVARFGLDLLRRGKVYGISGTLNRILITLSGFVPLAFSGVLARMAMETSRRGRGAEGRRESGRA